MKLVGTLQQDLYDKTSGVYNSPAKTIEMGMRVKLKEGSSGSSTSYDLTDKIVSMAVYIPTGATNTAFQVALQDTSYQQAISAAITLTAGKWNQLYLKADSKYTNTAGKLKFTTVDSTYAYVANGSYSSDTFNATAVSQIELRSLGDVSKAAIGDSATVYVDSLNWTNEAYATKAVAPTFSPAAGTYNAAQTVTLTSTSSGATIFYTTDGNDPTTSSSSVASGATITVDKSETVKAMAVASGIDNSSVASAAYVLQSTVALSVPAQGAYSAAQTVTLTATTGASIYYTISESGTAPDDPTTSSTVYPTGGISLALPSSGSTVYKIKAIAAGVTGWSDSTVLSLTYTLSTATPTAQTPTISLTAGAYTGAQTVTLTSPDGLALYYTYGTTGTAPTTSSSTVASGSTITLTSAGTLEVIAAGTGYNNSSVATATYTGDLAQVNFESAQIAAAGTIATNSVYISSPALTVNQVTTTAFAGSQAWDIEGTTTTADSVYPTGTYDPIFVIGAVRNASSLMGASTGANFDWSTNGITVTAHVYVPTTSSIDHAFIYLANASGLATATGGTGIYTALTNGQWNTLTYQFNGAGALVAVNGTTLATSIAGNTLSAVQKVKFRFAASSITTSGTVSAATEVYVDSISWK